MELPAADRGELQSASSVTAEQALYENDALLRGLFEHAPDAILVVDRQGHIVRVNTQAETMFGYSQAELVGQAVELLIPKRFQKRHKAHRNGYMVEHRLRPMGAAGMELLGQRKDGSELIVDLVLSPFTTSAGDLVIAVVRDVTERRQVEEALRESEAKLRALADNLPNGVIYQYVLEPDGRHYFTYLSAGIEQLAGIRAEEAIQDANKLHALFLEEDRQRLWQATLESAKNLTLFNIEARRRLPTGEIRWSHYRSAPRRLPGGKTVWDGVEVDITARVQAEEALRESEAKLRTLFEILPVGVTILDKDRHIVEVNPAVEKILDISKEGLLRGDYKNRQYLRADSSLMPPTEFPSVRAFNEQSLVANVEVGVVKEEGATIWTEVSATPLPVADLSVVVVTTDINDRKRAEQALKASEESYRLLAENAQDLIYRYRLRPSPGFEYISPSATAITGYTPEEHYADPFLGFKLVHPEDRALLESLQSPDSFSNLLTLRWIRRDGMIIWTEQRNSPIYDLQGNLVAIESVARDITDRKQAEQQLRQSEQKFSIFFEKAPFAASLSRPPDGVLVDVNEGFEKVFGYTKQEVVGKTSLELGLNPTTGERARILTALKEHGSVRNQEITLRTKSGEMRLFSVSVDLVDIGDQQYLLNTARDITDRKQAEAQLRASVREKEVLLKEVHHRVKNNLQTISSLLKLQAEQIDDDRILAIFQESQRRVRAMALIHETLYQSGELARVDFAQYLQQLLRYLFQSYGLQSSTIEARIDIEEIALDLDTAVACGLIINELVSNSLKHAFPTGPEKQRTGEIWIQMWTLEDQIRLTVKDNGIGLPLGLDFHQTETLGLQLVNILTADELEGTIEVDRTNGTSFKISFPHPNNLTRS